MAFATGAGAASAPSPHGNGSRRNRRPFRLPPRAAWHRRQQDRTGATQTQGPGASWDELALVRESPLARSVTSWPRSTNSSVNQETHALSPTVLLWRYAIGEGRDLRDAHVLFRASWNSPSLWLGLKTIRQRAVGSWRVGNPSSRPPNALPFVLSRTARILEFACELEDLPCAGTSEPAHRCK
jgi:hypothetical protein